jgi:hypothetical protein
VVKKDDVTLLFRVSGVRGRTAHLVWWKRDDINLLFRVSGVRGGMTHRVWWKRMTSPYCSGFPV